MTSAHLAQQMWDGIESGLFYIVVDHFDPVVSPNKRNLIDILHLPISDSSCMMWPLPKLVNLVCAAS